jgi:GNAT superfamily N-acetyltransferase
VSSASSIAIIPALPVHESFIFQTWLKVYRYKSPFGKRISNTVFFDRHHKVIERILARPSSQVLCAVDPTEHSTLYGYLAHETASDKHVIHFTYVKEAFRRLGIAKALFEKAGINPREACFTHRTYEFEWFEPKYTGIVYDPYLL